MQTDESPFLWLELVSPERLVYQGGALMVVLPAVSGEMGIMPRHAPLVTQLSTGRLRALTEDGQWMAFAVSDGFAKVQFNKVIVLADAAEEAGEIDVEKARLSLERALHRLDMYYHGTVPEGEEVDPFREQLVIRRTRNRLKVAEMA